MKNVSKRPFLGLLYVAEELISLGFLQKDPNNKDNILIYYEGDKENPEGWYSENIFSAMNETFNNERSLTELLEIAKEKGVDVDKHFENARLLLTDTRERSGLYDKADF